MKKKIEDFIELLNRTVSRYVKDIDEYAAFVDPEYVYSLSRTFYFTHLIDENDIDFEIRYFWKSNKEVLEELENKSQETAVKYNKIIVELDDLKNKVYSHRNEFCNFLCGFVDGYVTLRRIRDNSKRYMFVKSCQIVNNENSEYEKCVFNGITSEMKETTSIDVDPRVYILSHMTEKEFNDGYFPGRIRNCGLTNEIELCRYAVDLNEHFLKLKNRI